MAEQLYRDWYLRPDPSDAADVLGVPAPWEPDPVATLRAAHAGDGRFESGWHVERLSNRGRLLVRRGDRRRIVDRADVLAACRVLLPPRSDDIVSITTRHDVVDESGFWFTFVGDWDPEQSPQDVVRFYWAVRRSGLPLLVRQLTDGRLGGIPAALKVGAARHLLGRPDAAVLYARAVDADSIVPALRGVAVDLRTHLSARTPPLTRPLEFGLAAAEDPAGPQSFGQHRCEVLAAAVTGLAGDEDDETLLRHVRAALLTAGVDSTRPHRSAGSRLGDSW